MRAAVVVFPGTWSDGDCIYALGRVGVEAYRVWHREAPVFAPNDLVVLPGGFSYGDHLRCGAIARFSPVMQSVQAHAAAGGLVIGICNGFQILCEAALLPGVLMRNASLQFRCMPTHLVAENHASPFTRGIVIGRVLAVPISHGEGNYFADATTLDMLEATGRVERLAGERSELLGDGYRFHRSDGHTPGMVLCEVATARGPLLFCADLIPGVPWVRRAITMGYDRYPEQLIDEKTALLADLHDRGGRLFFTHDPQVAACGLERDEAGALVAAAPVAALRGEA